MTKSKTTAMTAKKTGQLKRTGKNLPSAELAEALFGVVQIGREVHRGYAERAMMRLQMERYSLEHEEMRDNAGEIARRLDRDFERMPDEIKTLFWREFLNTFRRAYGVEDLT